jgi:hypothetical protein
MQKTVTVLGQEVQRSQSYLDRVRERDAETPAAIVQGTGAAGGELSL